MSEREQHEFLDDLLREASGSFSVPPPPATWQQVEQNLRTEKKRRRLAWIILPIILAGGITWQALRLYSSSNSQQNNSGTNTPHATTGATAQNTPAPAPGPAPAAPPVRNITANNNSGGAIITALPPVHIMPRQQLRGARSKAVLQLPATNRHPAKITSKAAIHLQQNKKPAPVAGSTNEQAQAITTISTVTPTAGNNPAQQPALPAKTAETAGMQPPVEKKPADTQKNNAIPPVADIAIVPVKNKAPRWSLSVYAQSGGSRSALAYKTTGGNRNYGGYFGPTVAGQGLTTFDGKLITGLPHQTGFAGGLGINAGYRLNDKLRIESGLAYFTAGYTVNAYQTTPVDIQITQTGFFSNTVTGGGLLNSIYTADRNVVVKNAISTNAGPGGSSSIILRRENLFNRYHFLSLPLQAVWRPRGENKAGPLLRGGISLERRLNSKRQSLIYSLYEDRYFTEPGLETGWNAALTLQPGYALKLPGGHEVQAGIFGKYYTQSIYKKGLPLRENLFAGGVQLQYQIGKSKK